MQLGWQKKLEGKRNVHRSDFFFSFGKILFCRKMMFKEQIEQRAQ